MVDVVILIRQCHRLPICFFHFWFDKYNQKQELKELWLWDELACLLILDYHQNIDAKQNLRCENEEKNLQNSYFILQTWVVGVLLIRL